MRIARQAGLGMVRILCAFAILSLAFAHKTPQAVAAIATASVQLPDGTFADLCLGDNAVKHPAASLFCEACMLASSTLLPLPDEESWLVSEFASLENRHIEAGTPSARLSILRQRARAPPAIG